MTNEDSTGDAPAAPRLKKLIRLQTRIGLAVGAIIIILALALATLLAETAKREILDLSAANLEGLSEQMSRDLADGMDRFASDILTQTYRDKYRATDASASEMRTALDQFKQSNPDFAWVAVVDVASGRVIAATDGIFEKGDVRGRPVFEQSKTGPFLGDVHDAVRLAELMPKESTGEPLRFLDAGAPILSARGEPYRVLAGHIGWSWARRVAERVLGPVRDRRGIEVFLVDSEDKVVLTTSAKIPVGMRLNDITATSGEPAQKLTWNNNKEFLTYVAPVQARGQFNGFGWKVVAREPFALAYGPVQTLRWFFLIGALVLGVIAAALAWLIAGRIVRPLRVLADTAVLSERDQDAFNRFALDSSIGEVTAVQRAMRRMSSNVKQSIDATNISERQFEVLAAALPETVWQANARGEVEYINKLWVRSQRPSGVFKLDDLCELMPKDDGERFSAAWAEALATGSVLRVRCRLSNLEVKSTRWFEVLGTAVLTDTGEISRWVGTIFDVHDVVSLADSTSQELAVERTARTEAERLARMRDEFLAIASHELRSPLSAITGWSDILVRRGSDDPILMQAAEVIRRNALLQAALINDLLDMSAVIAGKLTLNRQPIDAAQVARDVVQSCLHAAQVKGVALTCEDAGPIVVSGDHHRIMQILSNLVGNAIKFTDAGGAITIEVSEAGPNALLTVRDNGRGIAPGFLPYVFDRLRQEDASATRRAGGMGLGLAIARGLVELHGGLISAASDGPGKGSTFTFTLPLADAYVSPGQRAPADDAAPDDLQGARILLVDDERDARDVARFALSSLGAQVRLAASAAEALAILKSEEFDVLVSDIGMPDMDGLSLMRAVRQLPREKNGSIAAVALTAFALEMDKRAGYAAGFHSYVTKPISLRRLSEGISRARENASSTS
jgi:signal transduction histidine kinase/ActR/RegA family two-component response regulator